MQPAAPVSTASQHLQTARRCQLSSSCAGLARRGARALQRTHKAARYVDVRGCLDWQAHCCCTGCCIHAYTAAAAACNNGSWHMQCQAASSQEQLILLSTVAPAAAVDQACCEYSAGYIMREKPTFIDATAASGVVSSAFVSTGIPPASVNAALPCCSWQVLPMLLQHSCRTAALLLSLPSQASSGCRAPAWMALTLVSCKHTGFTDSYDGSDSASPLLKVAFCNGFTFCTGHTGGCHCYRRCCTDYACHSMVPAS